MKRHEHLRLRIYDDRQPGKPWTGGKRRGTLTIGWGHTPMGAAKFDFEAYKDKEITEKQAQDLFDVDVAACVADVNRIVKVSLTQDQFDALVSRTYNMGPQNGSKLIKLVNAGKLSEAAEELEKGRSKKGYSGLSKRRSDEAALWNGEPVKGGIERIPEFLRRPSSGEPRPPQTPPAPEPKETTSAPVPKYISSASADHNSLLKSTSETRTVERDELLLYAAGELLKYAAWQLVARQPNPEGAILIAQGLFGKLGRNDYLVPLLGKLTAYQEAPDVVTATALYLQTLLILPVALGVGGVETMDVWLNYLDISQTGATRKAKMFPPGERIVEGFRLHPRTIAAEKGILRLVEASLGQQVQGRQPLRDREVYSIALNDLDPEGAIGAAIERGGSLEMDFEDPMTIPGLLAGGVGRGGASPGNRDDHRKVGGHVSLLVDRTNGTILVTPHFEFTVEDTVDFSPGNLGSAKARIVTVPMSILEKTGSKFGPVFAADVPLTVTFPGPGTSSLTIAMPNLPNVQKAPEAKGTPRKSEGTSE